MEKFFSKKINIALTAMLCCALWGSAFPIIKIGYKLLGIASTDYASQILFAGVRFTLAGILTLVLGSIFAEKILIVKKKNLPYAAILALFQTILQYLFFYLGLAHTTGTKSSVLDSLSVFFAVLISSLVLKQEKLTINKIIGCFLGFGGVVAINFTGGEMHSGFSFKGEGFIILSALSYAVSSVLIKRFSQKENPVALSGLQFALGGLVMILFGLVTGGRIALNSLKVLACVLYLALLSACAYTLWGFLLKYNEVSRVTVFGFMTPVFGCVLSALLLKESLSGSIFMTVLSLVLVCVGIFAVNFDFGINKKSKSAERETDGLNE